MRLISILTASLLAFGCSAVEPKPVKLKVSCDERHRLTELRRQARSLVSAVTSKASVVVLVRGRAAHAIVVGEVSREQAVHLATGLMTLLSFDYENVLVTVNNGMFRPGRSLRPDTGVVSFEGGHHEAL